MKRSILFVAMATFFLGNASLAQAQTPDSLNNERVDETKSFLKNKFSKKNVIGGLFNALNGNNTSPATQENAVSQDTVPQRNGQQYQVGGLINGILGDVLANSMTLSPKTIAGKWIYTGPKCVFETQNLLMKAGGEIAANRLEDKMNQSLNSFGFQPNVFVYQFDEKGNFSSNLGGRNTSGTYKLNAEKKTITLFYMGGLMRTTMHISLNMGHLCLLYDSEKLLNFLETMSKLSNSSAMKGLNSLLNAYDGMKIGLEFKK